MNDDTAPQAAQPSAALAEDQILRLHDLMARLGVTSTETIRRYRRDKKLPKPDVALSKRNVGWKVSTLRAAGVNV